MYLAEQILQIRVPSIMFPSSLDSIFFVFNLLVSLGQVIIGWATRLKIIDPDSKQDVGDEIVGHVFVAIAFILIFRLSDTIYT